MDKSAVVSKPVEVKVEKKEAVKKPAAKKPSKEDKPSK